MARDFYEVLGVPKNADQSEIQRSYRKLARTHHPDVNKYPSAEARFKEISEAYDVLSDPDEADPFSPLNHLTIPCAMNSSQASRGRTSRPWTCCRTLDVSQALTPTSVDEM